MLPDFVAATAKDAFVHGIRGTFQVVPTNLKGVRSRPWAYFRHWSTAQMKKMDWSTELDNKLVCAAFASVMVPRTFYSRNWPDPHMPTNLQKMQTMARRIVLARFLHYDVEGEGQKAACGQALLAYAEALQWRYGGSHLLVDEFDFHAWKPDVCSRDYGRIFGKLPMALGDDINVGSAEVREAAMVASILGEGSLKALSKGLMSCKQTRPRAFGGMCDTLRRLSKAGCLPLEGDDKDRMSIAFKALGGDGDKNSELAAIVQSIGHPQNLKSEVDRVDCVNAHNRFLSKAKYTTDQVNGFCCWADKFKKSKGGMEFKNYRPDDGVWLVGRSSAPLVGPSSALNSE
eukprot:Polyplicarium_translucidae@DN1845_c0_g1_i1.p1